MRIDPHHAVPPSPVLLWSEWRSVAELAACGVAAPWLATLPKGDGHPVLVLPGLATSDLSTTPLRRFLKSRDYSVYGWKMGRNSGYREGVEQHIRKRLREIYKTHGRRVSLIGWSLGGIYARQLAKMAPEEVRMVITLGSPFRGNPRASHAWRLYESMAGHSVDEVRLQQSDIETPPPVPFTSIYSRSDGIVAWECCVEEEGDRIENIEVEASHCGIAHHPTSLGVIADRLAQPSDTWTPYAGGLAGWPLSLFARPLNGGHA